MYGEQQEEQNAACWLSAVILYLFRVRHFVPTYFLPNRYPAKKTGMGRYMGSITRGKIRSVPEIQLKCPTSDQINRNLIFFFWYYV